MTHTVYGIMGFVVNRKEQRGRVVGFLMLRGPGSAASQFEALVDTLRHVLKYLSKKLSTSYAVR
jgi:hypothetical protein